METKKNYRYASTFGTAYGTGWNVMSDNFLRFLLIVLVLGVILLPMSVLNVEPESGFNRYDYFRDLPYSLDHLFTFSALGLAAAFLGFLGLLYNFLVLPVFQFGGKLMFLQGVRGNTSDFDNFISGFRKNYLNIVLANLLMTALIGIGFVCIIIPGIIIACRLVFTPYLVMDRGLDPIQAVEESWRLTRGHGWTVFFMALVSFFICIAGILCLFFGVFIAIMWIKSSFATLYHSLLLEKGLIEPAAEETVA